MNVRKKKEDSKLYKFVMSPKTQVVVCFVLVAQCFVELVNQTSNNALIVSYLMILTLNIVSHLVDIYNADE